MIARYGGAMRSAPMRSEMPAAGQRRRGGRRPSHAPALDRRFTRRRRELYVATGGAHGLEPPQLPNCETLDVYAASKRLAWVRGARAMTAEDLLSWLIDRYRAQRRRGGKGCGVISLARLSGGHGAFAVRVERERESSDCAFLFTFPIRSQHAPRTEEERAAQHARDLRALIAFLHATHHRTLRALASGPNACVRCGRRLRPEETQCAACGAWRRVLPRVNAHNTMLLSTVQTTAVERIFTGTPLDLVLGGGVVRGGVVMVGGQPGAGKSTLMLTAASGIADACDRPVAYVNVEQTAPELRISAERLGVRLDRLLVFDDFGARRVGLDDDVAPAAIIVDSISALVGTNAHAAVAVARRLKQHAVRHRIPALVVAHIAKDEDFGGLMALQHEVDGLVTLTVDESGTRTLMARKHRYGTAFERHQLIMTDRGLAPVAALAP